MRLSFLRMTLVACVFTLTSSAQVSVTVPKLIEFVKSSISQKLADKDVAIEVAKLRLTQKLEDQTIEDLQTAGAGPRTVAALTKLADDSAQLPPPPPPPPPQAIPTGGPPPSKEEQRRIIEAVREYALNYSRSLPDFLCLQVTNRSVNHNYKPGDQGWTPQDRLIEKLSFVDHQEKYELQSRNDNAMIGKTWETVGGSLSRGEWASLLQAVFDPGTETYFSWSRWANLRGKRYHVYRYQVDQAHSRETLDAEGKKVTPAFHGDIYIPFDSNVVWWISVEPEPPADFPMQDVKEVLKYNYVEISGQQFLLPLTSEVVMREGRIGNRNEIEFRRYQKYSADAVIKFDDIDVPGADDKAADRPADKPGDNKKKPPKP